MRLSPAVSLALDSADGGQDIVLAEGRVELIAGADWHPHFLAGEVWGEVRAVPGRHVLRPVALDVLPALLVHVERIIAWTRTAAGVAYRVVPYPVRDRDSSSYIATFEPASIFADLVKAEGTRRGADHVRQFTILGDGAAWIWNIASSKFPRPPRSWTCSTPASTCTTSPASWSSCSWTRKANGSRPALEDLDHGDIDGICRAARAYRLEGIKKDELDTALGYFENNAPRMRYHWFRQCGLFVGSGVVKAGCKTVIGQRLKLSGMHWTTARRRRHHHPALPAGQQARRPDLARTTQPAASRLTSRTRQTTLLTYKFVAHPP